MYSSDLAYIPPTCCPRACSRSTMSYVYQRMPAMIRKAKISRVILILPDVEIVPPMEERSMEIILVGRRAFGRGARRQRPSIRLCVTAVRRLEHRLARAAEGPEICGHQTSFPSSRGMTYRPALLSRVFERRSGNVKPWFQRLHIRCTRGSRRSRRGRRVL